MRKVGLLLLCLLCLCSAVNAQEDEALIDVTPLEDALPEEIELGPVQEIQAQSFWERLGALLRSSLRESVGSYRQALCLCALLLCVLVLCAVLRMGSMRHSALAFQTGGALGLSALCMGSFPALITLASETIQSMTDYAAASMPVLATAVAMNGAYSSAQALYAGTVLFAQLLLQLVARLLIPMVYFYLAIATADAAIGTGVLAELRDLIGWLISISLRLILYAFLAYMSLSGVISGSADAAAVKATKAAVSGMVPVVGGVISDASETLLAGAGMLKSSIGVFGMLAVLGICIAPFLRIGVQYLLLKLTAAVSGAVGMQAHVRLLKDFSTAMGYLLAMCGTCVLLLLIAGVCFLKVVV